MDRILSSQTIYNHWTQASYEVRVRGTDMYLWGSAGISHNINFDKPLLLHLRNDVLGESVTFGTETGPVGSKVRTTLGALGRGECVSLQIQNISGVFATCDHESTVGCLIKG